MIESPQSFVTATKSRKAAEQNGFRRLFKEDGGWAAFQSTTASGTIWLAAAKDKSSWFLALDHAGVIAELDLSPSAINGPGQARFDFASLRELYEILPRVYQLGISLPDGPLRHFQKQTQNLPKETEVERSVIQRVGQGIFRESLLEYWNGCCPLTQIREPALLRASHILPWSSCANDAERLSVHNGILLSALWDAAFDQGLVSFQDNGVPLFSECLGGSARSHLHWTKPINFTSDHARYLEWHRVHLFQGNGEDV